MHNFCISIPNDQNNVFTFKNITQLYKNIHGKLQFYSSSNTVISNFSTITQQNKLLYF